ncbi:unnamed protein product [Calicophoron daubneyi]|uniref:G-protein coupled receptors family 1 profile domain-containing protein n=1 Tax=Calicophoron daubneyi TaxID=300641 RepID=A0AAV2U1P7_CALDB
MAKQVIENSYMILPSTILISGKRGGGGVEILRYSLNSVTCSTAVWQNLCELSRKGVNVELNKLTVLYPPTYMNETAVASFPTYGKAIIAVLATTVSTATLGGNVVVLMAFIVESSVRIPSNYFIASLAVTDVLIGLFSMNLFISYQLLGYWPLSQLICNIWLTLDFSACLTSQYTVFLITLDRYCSVKIPMSYQSWRTLAKVRWMICLSWILPAVLFTTLIMGWKQITGEPPRAEGKCDVSFTYYPVFNTTLIVGYFWTTLIVMCSLYVGIYKVARRLQKKAQAKGSTFAALFNMGEKENDEEEDPSDEAMRQPTVTKCVKQGPLIAADSGYRGSNTPLEVPVDGICGNQSGKRISMQKTITEDCQRDILLPNNVTNEDLSSLYSPLKTSEDICKLRSPQDLEISETLSQSSQTSTSGNDKVTLLEQLSVRHSKNNDREETNLGCLHQPGRENERCKDDSLTYRESKINGIKRSDFTDIDPIFRPKIFYCECEKKLDKYEQSSDLRSPENLIHENSTSSDSPSSIPSIIPVKKFVPSPKVPISVPAEGGQTESIKANHNYSAQSLAQGRMTAGSRTVNSAAVVECTVKKRLAIHPLIPLKVIHHPIQKNHGIDESFPSVSVGPFSIEFEQLGSVAVDLYPPEISQWPQQNRFFETSSTVSAAKLEELDQNCPTAAMFRI